MRTIQFAALVLTVTILGCSSEARITSGDKAKISSAALAISTACISSGPGADVSTVEDAVTNLLDARDKFGDQRFTISPELADVTVQDIIDRQAALMRENDCVRAQIERLSGT